MHRYVRFGHVDMREIIHFDVFFVSRRATATNSARVVYASGIGGWVRILGKARPAMS